VLATAVEVTQAKKNAEALCAKLRDLRLKKLKEVA
jgi:DNA (cytosine-5)-methyltransferase 1